jgi:sec-independent protein translocase protein TatB
VFGIGLMEIAVVVVVAILVFGPDRIPDFARQAGQIARQVRRMANNARDELRAELGPEYADLELRDLDPREIVRRHIAEALVEDEEESARPARRGLRPLADGELPPYDVDAT